MYINNSNLCWNIKNAVRGEKHTRKRSLCGWRCRAGCRAGWFIQWLGCGHLRRHVINFCGWAQSGWEECYKELEMSAKGGKYLLSRHIFQGEIISNITERKRESALYWQVVDQLTFWLRMLTAKKHSKSATRENRGNGGKSDKKNLQRMRNVERYGRRNT